MYAKATFRVVLDTLADKKFTQVANKTSNVLQHVADTTHHVSVWAQKTTSQKST